MFQKDNESYCLCYLQINDAIILLSQRLFVDSIDNRTHLILEFNYLYNYVGKKKID